MRLRNILLATASLVLPLNTAQETETFKYEVSLSSIKHPLLTRQVRYLPPAILGHSLALLAQGCLPPRATVERKRRAREAPTHRVDGPNCHVVWRSECDD